MAAHAPDELAQRLDGTYLVVGEHQRHDDRPIVDRGIKLVRVESAVAVDRQHDELEAELLQVAQRMQHGMVVDGTGDEPVASRLAGPCCALEREG